jgi:hypothetical protein
MGGFNNDEIKDFAGDNVKIEVIREGDADRGIPPCIDRSIKTLEGVMTANVGDYIIKGVNGEFYPCRPDPIGIRFTSRTKISYYTIIV